MRHTLRTLAAQASARGFFGTDARSVACAAATSESKCADIAAPCDGATSSSDAAADVSGSDSGGSSGDATGGGGSGNDANSTTSSNAMNGGASQLGGNAGPEQLQSTGSAGRASACGAIVGGALAALCCLLP